jgi:hypothetical protein
VLSVGVAGSWRDLERVSDCSVVDEAVRLGGGDNRAGGGV